MKSEINKPMLRIKVFFKHINKMNKTKLKRTNEEYD